MVGGRLSQKAVTDMFYDMCKSANVPTDRSRRGSKTKFRTGCLQMGGAYGRIRVEYEYPQSGAINSLSGYLNAREMYMWLGNFNPRAVYRSFRKRDKDFLASQARRRAAQGR